MRTHSLFLVGVVLVLGCNKAPYQHAPVSGTVTMDGRPLADVAVSFQPIGEGLNLGAGSSGRTNAQGEFMLSVIGGGKGAVVGWHRVEINPTVDGNPDDDRHGPAKVRIPTKYNLQSELKFEVKPGNNTANFPLNSK